jgi:hypothetical protein
MNPIKNSKYLTGRTLLKDPYLRQSLNKIKNNPIIIIIDPCPISPNIIPKKNGKVTIVITAGLASRYVGMPYVSTTN